MSPTEYQSEQEQMSPIEYQSEPGTDVAIRISKWVGEWWGNSEMFENFPQVLQWWESWTCRSLVPCGFAKPTVRRGLVQWYPSMDSGSHPLSAWKPTGEVGSGCHAVTRESGREKKRKVWPFLNTCRGNLHVFSIATNMSLTVTTTPIHPIVLLLLLPSLSLMPLLHLRILFLYLRPLLPFPLTTVLKPMLPCLLLRSLIKLLHFFPYLESVGGHRYLRQSWIPILLKLGLRQAGAIWFHIHQLWVTGHTLAAKLWMGWAPWAFHLHPVLEPRGGGFSDTRPLQRGSIRGMMLPFSQWTLWFICQRLLLQSQLLSSELCLVPYSRTLWTHGNSPLSPSSTFLPRTSCTENPLRRRVVVLLRALRRRFITCRR